MLELAFDLGLVVPDAEDKCGVRMGRGIIDRNQELQMDNAQLI